MMRVIFLLLLSSIAFQSNSQTWNNYLQKRFKSYGIWADSILLVPNDTSLNKTGFAIKGSTAYIGDGVKWTAITGGSSVVDSLVYATKANVIKVRDSLLAADNFWSGVNTFLNTLNVSNDLQLGAANASYGNAIFYNANNSNKVQIFSSDTLATDVDIELPTSSGKLALTTDIAIVDTSIISTKAYVNYKDDIQQGYIDMRKLDADSSADNGYTSRGRLKQYGDSLSASQAVINGVQNDSLLIHNTRILANQNATNTNAANINLKVNIADTLPMLAGYRDASILSSGTLLDARLSSNVNLLNATQTVTGAKTHTADLTISKNTPALILKNSTNKLLTISKEEGNISKAVTEINNPGGAGNSVVVNNSTQNITYSATGLSTAGNMTISGWFYLTSVLNQTLFCVNNTNTSAAGNLGLRINGSLFVMRDGSYGSGIDITGAYTLNTWNYFALIKNGSNFTIRVNNNTYTDTYSYTMANGTNGIISNNISSIKIDQFLVYNTNLPNTGSNSLATIYNSGAGTNTPPTSNLVRWYEFEEGSGTTVQDLSVSLINATLNNSPSWGGPGSGKVTTSPYSANTTIFNISNGLNENENGTVTWGDVSSGTVLQGISARMLVGGFTSFIHKAGKTLLNPANTNTNTTPLSTLNVVGNVGIGTTNFAATSRLHLSAGLTSASSGQIKLDDGVNPSVAENGLINRVGSNVMFTADGLPYNFIKGFIGGHSSSITAETSVTVTIGVTMPNTNYRVNITPTSTLAVGGYISNKTTTQFTYTFPINTGTITFDWLVNQ